MIDIAFSGTSWGMTELQWRGVQQHYARLSFLAGSDTTARHGDCIGADFEFHHIAYAGGALLHLHPQNTRPEMRGLANEYLHSPSAKVHPARPPIARNHHMVDACDVLIAAPSTRKEVLRSGTWATIRYARKVGKPCVIVYPDGAVDDRDAVQFLADLETDREETR